MGLRSLKEGIDTDSSTGEMVFHIFGALASSTGRSFEERVRRV